MKGMANREPGEVLAENLRLALAKTKLTRIEVAQRVGMTRARLSSLENHNSPIRATELWDLAGVLGLSPGWFYQEHIPELSAS